MATPVSNLTRDQAHDEFRKPINPIATKNEELLLGECRKATGNKFIDKVQELSPLYA